MNAESQKVVANAARATPQTEAGRKNLIALMQEAAADDDQVGDSGLAEGARLAHEANLFLFAGRLVRQ